MEETTVSSLISKLPTSISYPGKGNLCLGLWRRNDGYWFVYYDTSTMTDNFFLYRETGYDLLKVLYDMVKWYEELEKRVEVNVKQESDKKFHAYIEKEIKECITCDRGERGAQCCKKYNEFGAKGCFGFSHYVQRGSKKAKRQKKIWVTQRVPDDIPGPSREKVT
jgi:hypothetical protein